MSKRYERGSLKPAGKDTRKTVTMTVDFTILVHANTDVEKLYLQVPLNDVCVRSTPHDSPVPAWVSEYETVSCEEVASTQESPLEQPPVGPENPGPNDRP